jgi:hypothetical protein
MRHEQLRPLQSTLNAQLDAQLDMLHYDTMLACELKPPLNKVLKELRWELDAFDAWESYLDRLIDEDHYRMTHPR